MEHHSRVKGCQKSEHIQANDRDKRARHGRRREIKSSAKRTKSSTTATMIICKLTNWTRRGCHHRHGPSLDGEHSNDGEHTTKPNLPDAKPSTRREQRLRLAVTITRVLLASNKMACSTQSQAVFLGCTLSHRAIRRTLHRLMLSDTESLAPRDPAVTEVRPVPSKLSTPDMDSFLVLLMEYIASHRLCPFSFSCATENWRILTYGTQSWMNLATYGLSF